MKQGLTAMVMVCLTFIVKAESSQITVGTYQDHIDVISEFVNVHGCIAPDNADTGENQILTEYLIFCSALAQSDTNYTITLLPYPVNTRLLDGLSEGLIKATAVGIWKSEYQQFLSSPEESGLALSLPLFRPNEFIKGLYTTRENLTRFAKPEQLTDIVALANENWTLDWNKLQCAGFKAIHIGQYENMFRMLVAGRGDVVPLTFSNKPALKREEFGVALYPVPGVKLAFDDSTHFVADTRTDAGRAFLKDLNTGLSRLREQGVIRKAYDRLGITNEAVEQWEQLGRCN